MGDAYLRASLTHGKGENLLKIKKLHLSKETIRQLENGELRIVAGGVTKEDMMPGCSAGTPYCGGGSRPPNEAPQPRSIRKLNGVGLFDG